MPLTGGESDKFGNWYEGLWTVLCITEILDERADSICLEVLGDKGEGVEFRLIKDAIPEFHQVKRQTTLMGGWTIASLKKVLLNFRNRLKAPEAKCIFISSDPTGPIRELSENARGANSWDDFKKHYLGKGKRHGVFDDLREHLPGYSDQDVYEFLKRTQFRNNDEQTLREYVDGRLYSLVQGNPGDVRRCLAEIAQRTLHKELYGTDFWKALEQEGFSRREWGKDPHVTKLVTDTNQRYVNRLLRYAIGGNLIHREETQKILDKLLDTNGRRAVLVTGQAGFGKTGIILDVFQHLQEKSVPVLAIRIDSVEPASHPDQLGEKFGLPGSPLHVLRAIAKDRPCVLVIDQLDAVSLTSGRNPEFFHCVEEILNQSALDPQMHLLLGCRKFDLINDHRLMKLVGERGIAEETEIGPLHETQVRKVLNDHRLDLKRFTKSQLKILSVPLHLWLLLQMCSDRDSEIFAFEDEHKLFDTFWEFKKKQVRLRAGAKVGWTEIIDTLSDYMSSSEVLAAPKEILDNFSTDAEFMASENILAFDGNNWAFFHEDFFDYVFARSFVRKGRNLLDWLKETEQHLFKRAQVRQILRFMRTPARKTSFFGAVTELVNDSGIRFHIKRIVFAIMADLKDPSEEEWNILAPFVDARALVAERIKADPIARQVWKTLRGSVGWFDLLDSLGVIQAWLSDQDESRVDQVVWLLSGIQNQRADRVAELVWDFASTSKQWDRRLIYLIDMGDSGRGRKFFDLALKLLANGFLDEIPAGMISSADFWSFFHELPARQAAWACDLTAQYLRRRRQVSLLNGEHNPFENEISDSYYAKTFLNETAVREPRLFSDIMIDFILPVLEQTAEKNSHGPRRDPVWGPRMFGERERGITDALLEATETALARLASESPDALREVLRPLLDSDLDSIRFLIVRAYSANGEEFAHEASDYLLSDLSRFKIGYANCSYWATRMLLQAITPHCLEHQLWQLESAILHALSFSGSREHRAHSQFILLDAVDEQRRSESAWIQWFRISEFLGLNSPVAPMAHRSEAVGSPVPEDEVMDWSDSQWLAGIAEYRDEGRDFRRSDGKLGGGAWELSRLLEKCVKREPARFVQLMRRFPDDANRHYFDALLRGIAEEEVEADTVAQVCIYCHRVAGRTCGTSLCWLVVEKADLQLPTNVVEIVVGYATARQEPIGQVENRETTNNRVDSARAILTNGMNSTKGAAVLALGHVLRSDRSRLSVFLPVLKPLVEDPSPPIRACVAFLLRVVLLDDHQNALTLFRSLSRVETSGPTIQHSFDYLCQTLRAYGETTKLHLMRLVTSGRTVDDTAFSVGGIRVHLNILGQLVWRALRSRNVAKGPLDDYHQEDVVFATEHVASFLYQALPTHFSRLSDLIWRILKSPMDEVRKIGAHAACIAALENAQARVMAWTCMSGDEKQRIGAAEVFAKNVRWQGTSSYCAQCLRKMFQDHHEGVRSAAARCFYGFKNEELGRFAGLVEAFVDSPAFETYPDSLVSALNETTAKLPEITCRVCETFLDRLGEEAADIQKAAAGQALEIGKLVLRLYSQTEDPGISSRCLDIIDQMAQREVYGVEDLLVFDRERIV